MREGSTQAMPRPAERQPDGMPERILRMPEVIARSGLSRATIYRYVRGGRFPPSVSLGGRIVGWKASTVQAWIDSLSGAP